MNIIYISSLLSIIILVISNSLGNKVNKNILHNTKIIPELLGLTVWIGFLSIIGFFMLFINVSTEFFFMIFLGFSLIILVVTFKDFKWNYTKAQSLFIFGFLLILIILSLKYRLGEEMGDNTYLMNMVSMNNIRPNLNTTGFDNGLYFGTNFNAANKEYLTWYHFFSFLTFYTQKILSYFNLLYIPSSLLFVWTGNFVFYIFSAMIVLNIIRNFEIKSKWIIAGILVVSLYWGTVYYNLVLAHYGSNFVSIFVISLWMLLLQIKELNIKSVILIILNIYAIASMGNVGLITASYIVFAYVLYEVIRKNERIFLWVPFFLLPIFHWIWILKDIIPTKWLISLGIGLSLFSWFVHYIKPIKKFIFNYIIYILILILIVWYSLAIFKSDNYLHLFLDFFEPKSNFDRLQDYFSFVKLNDALRNIAYYLAISFLFINERTRKAGWMILIILVFFINPIVYPMLYPSFQWLYHRAYISVFNIFVIMIGIWSMFEYLLRKTGKVKFILISIWILLLVPSTYQQVTGYFHKIYISGPDFNIFYKMDNAQIDVLEKLRQIVTIEKYENAKVVSQIYGTTMYLPEVYHMYFNFSNRRIYDSTLSDEAYDPLNRIFYTPVFAGDDGPRFNAPYEQTCTLLIDNKVDFVIYDKELSVYDKTSMNWIPLHWYARGCAENSYENELYILYRFYWK